MKIISKYKDYYDYLMGIYGVDEKIVLDRTEFGVPLYSNVVRFYICGKRLDGYFDSTENRFYFGDDLVAKFPKRERKVSKWLRRFYANRREDLTERSVSIPRPSSFSHLLAYPDLALDLDRVNEKNNCPIMCSGLSLNEFIRFPKLEETGISKILPPQEIYLMLCEWLAPKDDITDNRTDVEKLLSAGFDKKSSFRNVK